jgi:hypothetical protein
MEKSIFYVILLNVIICRVGQVHYFDKDKYPSYQKRKEKIKKAKFLSEFC